MNFTTAPVGTISKQIIATNDMRRVVVAVSRVLRIVVVELIAALFITIRVVEAAAHLTIDDDIMNKATKSETQMHAKSKNSN